MSQQQDSKQQSSKIPLRRRCYPEWLIESNFTDVTHFIGGGLLGGLGDTVGKTVGGLTNTVGGTVSGLGNTVGGATEGLGKTVSGATEGLGNTAKDVGQGVSNGFQSVGGKDQTADNPLGLNRS